MMSGIRLSVYERLLIRGFNTGRGITSPSSSPTCHPRMSPFHSLHPDDWRIPSVMLVICDILCGSGIQNAMSRQIVSTGVRPSRPRRRNRNVSLSASGSTYHVMPCDHPSRSPAPPCRPRRVRTELSPNTSSVPHAVRPALSTCCTTNRTVVLPYPVAVIVAVLWRVIGAVSGDRKWLAALLTVC
jgi:hypothetical protein